MAKYDPLREYLRKDGSKRITITFEQIGLLVGGQPRSAYEHQAFCANECNPKTQVWKIAWCDAGYQVASFNQIAKRVTFEKTPKTHRNRAQAKTTAAPSGGGRMNQVIDMAINSPCHPSQRRPEPRPSSSP